MHSLLLAAALTAADTVRGVPEGALLLVANKQEASLSIIEVESGKLLATVPTGQGPHEVAVTGNGRFAVVANYGAQAPGNTLTVVDLRTRAPVGTIDLGEYRRPHGIVVLPGDSLVLVTSEASRSVVLVALEGGVRGAIATGAAGSHMVAVTADGRRGYTANVGSGSITELDIPGGVSARTLPVAPATEGIAVTPDGREVWVGSNGAHTVTIVDTRTWKAVDTLPAAGLPYRVAISPDGRTAVVPAPQAGVVRIFDVPTRRERAVLAFEGAGPVGSTITADGAYVFVALQGSNEAAMVDLKSGKEVRRFATGAGPDGIATYWPAR